MKSHNVRFVTSLMTISVLAGAAAPVLAAEAIPEGDLASFYANVDMVLNANNGNNSESSSSKIVVACPEDSLNVRKSPSFNSEITGKLSANDVATVVEDNGSEWIQIKSGDVTGYVMREYVVEGSAAESLAQLTREKVARISTSTGNLRIREGAGTDYDIVARVHDGDEVEVVEENGDWIKVATTDGEGYISAEYATIETSYPTGDTMEVVEARNDSPYETLEDAKADAMRAENVLAKAQALTASGKTSAATAIGVVAKAKMAADATATKQAKAQKIYDESFSGEAVVRYAMQFIGNPYVWGGESLTHGCDCSGFTKAVYAHFGVSLPHYDAAQRSCGVSVSSLSEARPGDLICYYGHVAIYIGDGKIVHASNHRDGIKVSNNAAYRSISAIRRIFP